MLITKVLFILNAGKSIVEEPPLTPCIAFGADLDNIMAVSL